MNNLSSLFTKFTSLVRHGGREMSPAQGGPQKISGLERLVALFDSLACLMRQVSVKGFLVTGMLLLLVVMSAIGVVYSSHLSRQLFAEQAILLERNDQMQLEWAQLLLEQSAWSSPSRVEAVAHDKLGMEVPKTEEIQLIY